MEGKGKLTRGIDYDMHSNQQGIVNKNLSNYHLNINNNLVFYCQNKDIVEQISDSGYKLLFIGYSAGHMLSKLENVPPIINFLHL